MAAVVTAGFVSTDGQLWLEWWDLLKPLEIILLRISGQKGTKQPGDAEIMDF